jgi:hypothetical protein
MSIKKPHYEYDNDTGIRTGTINIRGKTLKTPLKSIEPNRFLNQYPLSGHIHGINEIFKSVRGIKSEENKKRIHCIEEIRKDSSKEARFNGELNYFPTNNNNEINICFMGFEDTRFPDKNELRFLTTRSYCYSSDLVPFPVLSNIKNFVDISRFDEYLNFLERCYAEIDLINNKAKMGVIQTQLGAAFIDDILKFYVDHDITSYFFDFGGSNITTKYPMIVDFYKMLKEYSIEDETFLYALNPARGKAGHKKSIVNSKDVIAYGYGFDILGRYQPPFVPPNAPPIDITKRKFRVINKEDYGYHNVIGNEFESIYPKDSSIPLAALKNIHVEYSRTGRAYLDMSLVNLFNVEQKGLEARKLPTIVKENETKDYLSIKEHVDPKDMHNILEFRENVDSKKK